MSEIQVTPQLLYSAAHTLDQRARSIQYIVDETSQIIQRTIYDSHLEGHQADALIVRYRHMQYQMAEWSEQFRYFSNQLRLAAAAFEEADRGAGPGASEAIPPGFVGARAKPTIPSYADGIYTANGRQLTGNMRDGQLYWVGEPSEKGPSVIFVNGIQNEDEDFINSLRLIAGNDAWTGERIAGIYNDTSGKDTWKGKIVDSWQGVNDQLQASQLGRLDGGNPAVDELVKQVEWHIANNPGEPLELVAHSQGAAITSAALHELAQRDVNLSSLQVTTFGGFGVTFPIGPDYHHYVFAEDSIPVAAEASYRVQEIVKPYQLVANAWASGSFFADFEAQPEAAVLSYQDMTVIPCPDFSDNWAHGFETYANALDAFEQDAVQDNWLKQQLEYAEFEQTVDNAVWAGVHLSFGVLDKSGGI